MNDSNQSTSFDIDTPIRLPKTSLLSEKDIISINMSQEEEEEEESNEILWSDSEVARTKDAPPTTGSQNTAQSKENQEKGRNEQKGRKKRKLMKYGSNELLIKKEKREALPRNQQKIDMLINPAKVKATPRS